GAFSGPADGAGAVGEAAGPDSGGPAVDGFPGDADDPVAGGTAEAWERAEARPPAVGRASELTAVHTEEPVVGRLLEPADGGGGKGVAAGRRSDEAGILGLLVVVVDAVPDRESVGPVVGDDDLLGVFRIDGDLHVDAVGPRRDDDVREDEPVGVVGSDGDAG